MKRSNTLGSATFKQSNSALVKKRTVISYSSIHNPKEKSQKNCGLRSKATCEHPCCGECLLRWCLPCGCFPQSSVQLSRLAAVRDNCLALLFGSLLPAETATNYSDGLIDAISLIVFKCLWHRPLYTTTWMLPPSS